MRRVALGFVLVLALSLSGCSAPSTHVGGSDGADGLDDGELGRVGGYDAADELAVNASEGLTESELEAVKYRTMARIELLRGLEFEEDVELEVVDRDAVRERFGPDGPADAFTNELWRAAFVVDEGTDVNEAMDDLYGGSVLGYYSGGSIVIVSDDPESLRIGRTTLVHELVHALQDQRFGLDRRATTIDEQRAESGLFEGEANYVPTLYDRRCGEEWQCLTDPEPGTGELDERPFNAGLFVSVYAPYAAGPPFVESLHERAGWDAVDAAHEERPASTAQVIHPERYPDDRPANVSVTDRSDEEWEPIRRGAGEEGEPRTETVGEATLFAALWYNGAIDRPLAEGGDGRYNYSHPITDGWAGDRFVAYTRDGDDGDGAETAHVWRLAWESEADAEQFRDGYRAILENGGAERVDGRSADGEVYRIADDRSFAGAYRLSLEGETVEIVGAPTVDDLEAVRGSSGSERRRVSTPPTAATEPTGAPGPTARAGG